jgi:multicomponent Na+:H+ antiporter subunit E
MLRRLPMVVWITAVWIALWGDLSWGNLLGGILIALLVLTAVRLPATDTARRIALLPALWYFLLFLRDLSVATLEVARQVFWPIDRLRPAVLEVPLVSTDAGLLSLVSNSITLTPGTLTLEVDEETGTLWVHLLHLEEGGESDVVEQALALERLGARVLGIDLDTTRSAPGKEQPRR